MHELTEKQLKRRENRLRAKEEKLRKEEEARQQALILKQKTDEKFMKQALLQAKKAKELGEVPIGCVIVQAITDAIPIRAHYRMRRSQPFGKQVKN